MTAIRSKLLLSAVLATLSGTAHAQFGPGPFTPPSEVPTIGETGPTTRYIIRYKANSKSNAMRDIARGKGELKLQSENLNMVAVVMSKKFAVTLKGNPNIESIEIDPKRYLMAEETPYGIPMVQANALSDAGTGNQKVCIMDTGYDRSHIDLQAVRVTGNNNSQTGPWYQDGDGHGTHVAGTIAALGGNNEGVVGVNPGNKLNLHIIKVFNDSGNWAYGSDLVKAVDQCINAGATVISMSLGGEGSSAAEQAAFEKAEQAGLISVAAAGNDGITALNYPASYDSVISVAAVNANGARPSWSQYNNQVEIAAPGVNVKSTIPNNKYDSYSGTSMATPHVSGVAALVWSHYPDCSNDQIRSALNATAEDKGTAGRDAKYGYGIVKAKAAFDLLKQGCDASGGGTGGGGGGETGPTEPADPNLENGVAKTGLSGSAGENQRFQIQVPAGATDLKFEMKGSGDADLYVRAVNRPSQTTYDCRPYLEGSHESCSFASPEAGYYHVLIRGYTNFSNVSLKATFNDGSGTAPVTNEPPNARWWHRCDGLKCSFVGKNSFDNDGEIVKHRWKFGDEYAQNAINMDYTYSGPGTFKTILTVKDDDGAIDRKIKNVTVTRVSADGVAVSAAQDEETPAQVDLNWSGLSGEEVDIYMDGYLTDFTKNDGQWRDQHFEEKTGTHKYKVCEYGNPSKCSNEIKVAFE